MTNKLASILISSALFSLFSCNDSTLSNQEKDKQQLSNLFTEIQSIASSKICDHSEEWSFTSFGSKACGGPQGYLAYPLTINVQTFLQLVEEHRIKEDAYNMNWGIISDCSIPPSPTSVSCINGEPVLEY